MAITAIHVLMHSHPGIESGLSPGNLANYIDLHPQLCA
jgi:hypothetical protein